MKVRMLDKDGRQRYASDVIEVVIMDDDRNPINVSIQQGELVTCAHGAENGFNEVVRQCGLVPPEVKVVG